MDKIMSLARFPWFRLPPLAALALAGTTLSAFALPRVVPDEIDPVSLLPFTNTVDGAGVATAVQGDPFAARGVTMPDFTAAVTRIMSETFATRFVPAAGHGAGPKPFVALAFNPAAGLLPEALCNGRPVATEAARRPIVVRAATCIDGRAQSAATGYLDQAAGPADPGFTSLVQGLTQRLVNL
ncbi:hypothetical protein E9232_005390 [Inquilinus ginsengisoli]|uniref:DUF302 domain-containing protein n=1 Tax=Inquilinus ginsengisoli TaxID=363840 RepID=A0ABU1JZ62_9PROT|nr:hypothetical protein [Inquilinus ginsengisoli]MDR6292845.1 hypothetical protein [Inquilinus ginsengisoli]